jgi:hypothetical protein
MLSLSSCAIDRNIDRHKCPWLYSRGDNWPSYADRNRDRHDRHRRVGRSILAGFKLEGGAAGLNLDHLDEPLAVAATGIGASAG